MSDINSISITGRLGADPEMTLVGENETPKTTLRLASSRMFTKNGEKAEVTTWVPIVCWGKQAEVVNEYCKKGQSIAVSGRLDIDEYEDKEGNKRKFTSVIADNIRFGDRPSSSDSGSDSGSGTDVRAAIKSVLALIDSGIAPDIAIKATLDTD